MLIPRLVLALFIIVALAQTQDDNVEDMADETVLETLKQDLGKVVNNKTENKDKPSVSYDKNEVKHMAINNDETGAHQVVINSDVQETLVAGDSDMGSEDENSFQVKTVKVVILPNGQKIEKVIDEAVLHCQNATNTTTCLQNYFEHETSGFGRTILNSFFIVLISALVVYLSEQF